jgi:tRNA U34 2-thiouridine synthase MnmA/TrmU
VLKTDAATNMSRSAAAMPLRRLVSQTRCTGTAHRRPGEARYSPAIPQTSAADGTRARTELDEPFDGPAPGQAAVLMSGDTVVGHATIAA